MAFAQDNQLVAEVRARTQTGEIDVAYLDETGFASIHPNRSAWATVGEQHGIDATRGKRINVEAALLSNGTVIVVKLWCLFTAPLFSGFGELLKRQVNKHLKLILDNASVNTTLVIAPLMAVLRRQGVTLYFLPPYSPELNSIEKLWHLVKHRDPQKLEDKVGEVLDNVGTRSRITF